MKAYNLIYENSVVGYRIDTNTGLGVVDIDIATADKYGIEPDVFSSIDLYKHRGILKSKDEADNFLVRDISNKSGICIALAILTNISISSRYFSTVFIGDDLFSLVDSVSEFNTRFCLDSLLTGLNSTKSVTILYGVRRTGKTVLLLQSIKKLLDTGIPSNKILFCSVKQGTHMSVLNNFLLVIAKAFDIDYLFVDEFTYAVSDEVEDTQTDESSLSLYTEGTFRDKRFIFSGTNSAYFISPMNGVLYDRVNKISTSYISYKEFKSIYPRASIDSYMSSGGLLFDRNCLDDKLQIERDLHDYINTSVIDNMFHAFENTRLGDKGYSALCDMYYSDKDRARSFLYKCVQRYSSVITPRVVNSKLVSSDLSLARKALRKRISPEDLPDFDRILKKVSSDFIQEYSFINSQYTKDEIDSVKKFLLDLECLVQSPDGDMEFVVPFAIRRGCTLDTVKVLRRSIKDMNIAGVTKEILINSIDSAVGGILLESLVYCDLTIAGKKFSKARINDRKEIDLVLNSSDLYEIKATSNSYLSDLKWLTDREVSDMLKPTSRTLLYTGRTKIVKCTRFQVLNSVLEHIRRITGDNNLCLADIFGEDDLQDKELNKIFEVCYKNIGEFLEELE